MSNRTPSLGELLRSAIASRLVEVHTSLPAVVEKYDAATQLVDVKPQVKALELTEEDQVRYAALPVIVNVPLIFPGIGGFRLTFPVQRGDTVLLVFAEASIDRWLEAGGDVEPGDVHRFHLSDAVAIPGLHPKSKAWTGASSAGATLGKDGGAQLEVDAGEIRLSAVGAGSGVVPVAKEGSMTVGHVHAVAGTAGPWPVVATAALATDVIAPGQGSQAVKVP